MRERSITSLALVVVLLRAATAHASEGEPPRAPAADGGGAPADAAGSPSDRDYPPLDEQDALPLSSSRLRLRRAFAHPTVTGLLGGVHAVDASSGWPGTFRVSLQGGYFAKNSYLSGGDRHRYAAARLTVNVTPIEHLELAAQLVSQATQNRTTDPEVLQVVGDLHLFAKGFSHVLPWLALAGDAELALLNGVGSIGLAGPATSVALRASATADLRAQRRQWPLIARFNVRYLFDNGGRLARRTEDGRYAALSNAAPRDDEYRHLLTPAERAALQVNRLDRLDLRVGLEVPLAPSDLVLISPLLEWGIGLPINRQSYDCVSTRVDEPDGCLANEGFSARPSALTLGLRVQPYVRGLGLLLAVDVATGGHRTLVRELAPEPRYMVQLGLSYAFDPRPAPAPRARVERVEIPAAIVRGYVVGQVVEQQSGRPVAGAVVHFEGARHSDLLASDLGAFRSAELAPGAQGMRIRAPGYHEALCVVVVPTSGAEVGARCELTPIEQVGSLHGRVVDARGNPVADARITMSGPRALSWQSAADGGYGGRELPVGRYALRIEAPGYFSARAEVEVRAGGDATAAAVQLIARPSSPLAVLTPKRILLRRPLRFVDDTARLQPDATVLLAEIAALLEAHPEVALVEVQAHVDATGNGPAALETTRERAEAVRAALIAAGVAPVRLSALGFGASRPLVPNITPQNRARNRRVELWVKPPAAALP